MVTVDQLIMLSQVQLWLIRLTSIDHRSSRASNIWWPVVAISDLVLPIHADQLLAHHSDVTDE